MLTKTNKSGFSYYDLINLKDNKKNNPELLWSQKKTKKKRKLFQGRRLTFVEHGTSPFPFPLSHLQQSALSRVRNDRLKYNSIESSLQKSMTINLYCSRSHSQSVSIAPKKKISLTRTTEPQLLYKNSIKSMEKDIRQLSDLILYPHLIGLSELVYSQVMGKQRKINEYLIHSWYSCLLPEDWQEIYGNDISNRFHRVYPISQLQKGFTEIYGIGKGRTLTIGQQAMLIHHMGKYLQNCEKQVKRIARRLQEIISDILKVSKLSALQNMPICMKQIELIWKILATQWRYSIKIKNNKQIVHSITLSDKSNFVDLRKKNAITDFLFTYSNKNNKNNMGQVMSKNGEI